MGTIADWILIAGSFLGFTVINIASTAYLIGKVVTQQKTNVADIADLKKANIANADDLEKTKSEDRTRMEALISGLQSYATITMCDRCRTACEGRNSTQFHEIKELLRDSAKNRSAMMCAIAEISSRLGTIEGKLPMHVG